MVVYIYAILKESIFTTGATSEPGRADAGHDPEANAEQMFNHEKEQIQLSSGIESKILTFYRLSSSIHYICLDCTHGSLKIRFNALQAC